MVFTLTSPAFAPHSRIPVRHTCDGADVSPPLTWSGAPAQTQSFVIVCTDPDAPAGTWYHWAIYNISKDLGALPEHYPASGEFPQAVNDFGRRGYGGPCPPNRHGPHHYRFRIYALSRATLPLPGTHCRDVEHAAHANSLGRADLIGIYSR